MRNAIALHQDHLRWSLSGGYAAFFFGELSCCWRIRTCVATRFCVSHIEAVAADCRHDLFHRARRRELVVQRLHVLCARLRRETVAGARTCRRIGQFDWSGARLRFQSFLLILFLITCGNAFYLFRYRDSRLYRWPDGHAARCRLRCCGMARAVDHHRNPESTGTPAPSGGRCNRHSRRLSLRRRQSGGRIVRRRRWSGPSANSTGGCQCGAVRYALLAPPLEVSVCHCRMCQKASGGPIMAFARVARTDCAGRAARRLRSAARAWSNAFLQRLRDAARPIISSSGRYISVTVGSLDDPEAARPDAAIWRRKRAVVVRHDAAVCRASAPRSSSRRSLPRASSAINIPTTIREQHRCRPSTFRVPPG